jgi:hypothetical protein
MPVISVIGEEKDHGLRIIQGKCTRSHPKNKLKQKGLEYDTRNRASA